MVASNFVKAFEEFCKGMNIKSEFMIPYSPKQQNSVAKDHYLFGKMNTSPNQPLFGVLDWGGCRLHWKPQSNDKDEGEYTVFE